MIRKEELDMTKDYYIEKLGDAKECELDIVASIAGDDPQITAEELKEIREEVDNIKDEIRIARCEAADDRFFGRDDDWTDDELGLTQM